MRYQLKFNIKEMLIAFRPMIEKAMEIDESVTIAPWDTPTLERTGIVLEGQDGGVDKLRAWLKKYLEEKKINYTENVHA